ncbi:MAG: phosphotransferase [Betaproteobacteria bacterium]|nr:phosphotransferase [Betaproteobacteria bacterium]
MGRVLTFETRLGVLTSQLARRFESVVSLHAIAWSADAAREQVRRAALSNVRIETLPGNKQLCEFGRFDAVVLLDPDGDPTGQWESVRETLVRQVVAHARELLTERGCLLIGGDNSWSYQRIGQPSRRPGLALPRLKSRLGRDFALELFVGDVSVGSTHSPPPELCSAHVSLPPSIHAVTWKSHAKRRLLELPKLRQFWPAFVLIATRGDPDCFLSRQLRSMGDPRLPDWVARERVAIKRIIAGNHGVSVMIVGPMDRSSRAVVVKSSNTEAGKQLCRTNAWALEFLEKSAWQHLTPRLLGLYDCEGVVMTVESMCEGAELGGVCASDNGPWSRCCDQLLALQVRDRRMEVMTQDRFSNTVGHWIGQLKRLCEESLRTRLTGVERRLSELMIGRSFAMGLCHGDLKLGNLLFNDIGKLTGVIDWDGIETDGLIVFDYLTMMTYKLAKEEKSDLESTYVRHILPWELPPAYEQGLAPVVQELAPDSVGFQLLRIAFWFSLLHVRFASAFKLHRTWRSRMLDNVLPEMERRLAQATTL